MFAATALMDTMLRQVVGASGAEACAAVQIPVQSAAIPMRDGSSIDAKIYSPPPGTETVCAAVFAHGGCFTFGDCNQHRTMSEALASLGIAVIDTSYRQGAENPHPSAILDLEDVTKHARTTLWPNLEIGVAGSSSGGWLALALAADPPDGQPYPFSVAICPVSDPGLRADYLKSCVNGTAKADGYTKFHTPEKAAGMLKAQSGYFGSDQAMRDAGVLLSQPGKWHRNPTCELVILGDEDMNVPPQVTQKLSEWASQTITVKGYGHELQMAPPKAAKDCYKSALLAFVKESIGK